MTERRPQVRDRFAAVHRQVRRAFRYLAWVVSLPLLAATFLFVGFVPWLVGLPLRIDPLWAPRRRGSAWVPRDEAREQPATDLWLADPAPRDGAATRRRRRILPNALVTIGLLLGVKDLYRNLNPPPQATRPPLFVPPAAAPRATTPGQPDVASPRAGWSAEWRAAFASLLRRSTVSQYEGTDYPDVTSPWLNIRDDVRRSWHPPATSCRPVRVWAFGGSAMFGIDQRDNRTLASELARAAWADHVALDVENRAVPGDVAWLELARLRRALALGPAPDLVVFYDGAGDLAAVEAAYTSGREVTKRFSALTDRDVTRLLSRLQVEEVDGVERVAVDVPDASVRTPDEATIRDAVRFQFGAARELIDGELRGRIPSMTFLQPTIGSRDPAIPGDAVATPAARDAIAALRADLPAGVVDLADSLDGQPGTFSSDDVTDETANRAVAARMWAALAPVVAGLPPSTKGTRCG